MSGKNREDMNVECYSNIYMYNEYAYTFSTVMWLYAHMTNCRMMNLVNDLSLMQLSKPGAQLAQLGLMAVRTHAHAHTHKLDKEIIDI